MSTAFIMIAAIIHISICLFYFIAIKKRVAHLPESMLLVMALIPVFGPLCVLLLEWLIIRKKDGVIETDIHKMNLGDSIYNKTTFLEEERPQDIVPLEEAILINDVPTRRAIMLDILHRDPLQFIDLLMVARFNNDIEVTHYATTTIMEIQREFELAIQKMAVAVKENPENVLLLDKYIDVLGKYIDSGLLRGHLLEQQRAHYAIALAKSAELVPNHKDTYFKIIENDLHMKDYRHAEETARYMETRWPTDENVWLAGLRVCVESKNSKGKADLIVRMKHSPIDWTVSGKERMRFWCGEDFFSAVGKNLPENNIKYANEAI